MIQSLHLIKRKMEVSLEDTPKPRAALYQEGENGQPMVSKNVFDAQDTHENISKPRMALFKEGEDDELMVSEKISEDNTCPVSNMVTGLQFGAFSSMKNI